ncbi:MAG: class I SAM-dependent methyltransferase [Pseudomonadota bacterium]|nr:class I SAM-dependent methyltransferase [Pseudomonadota bacterium]
MRLINLLKKIPNSKRDSKKRAQKKTREIISKANEFGKYYFDGPREYGYGGYIYDGRWVPVAKDIINYFDLKPGDKILDIGCAKGFLVSDLVKICPGLNVYGLDISEYALNLSPENTKNKLIRATCEALPFSENQFDAVISINTIHNCRRDGVIKSLKEITRVSKGKAFIQVDAYHNEEQKKEFLDWVLTAKFHGYPDEWFEVFKEANYKGDYFWTLV